MAKVSQGSAGNGSVDVSTNLYLEDSALGD
jgi:hypothetical protein